MPKKNQIILGKSVVTQLPDPAGGVKMLTFIRKYSANPSPIYAKVSCSRKFRVNGYTHISLMGTLCLPASPSFPRP